MQRMHSHTCIIRIILIFILIHQQAHSHPYACTHTLKCSQVQQHLTRCCLFQQRTHSNTPSKGYRSQQQIKKNQILLGSTLNRTLHGSTFNRKAARGNVKYPSRHRCDSSRLHIVTDRIDHHIRTNSHRLLHQSHQSHRKLPLPLPNRWLQ